MIKRIFRTLRFLDDLAEAILLHVLLATPFRRRACAVLTVLAGLATYALSGFLFIPPQLDPTPPSQSYASPVCESWTESGDAAASLLVDKGAVTPTEQQRIREAIRANATALDSTVSYCSRPDRLRFDVTPNYRSLRKLATLLVARGILLTTSGIEVSPFSPIAGLPRVDLLTGSRSDRALADWIAARNLGIAAARGTGKPVLIDHMIGIAIERQAMRALTRYARSGEITGEQALLLSMNFRPRNDSGRKLATVLQNETEFVRSVLRNYSEANSWPELPTTNWLRLWLPRREEGRVAAAAELMSRLGNLHAESIRILQGNRGLVDGKALPEVPPLSISWPERVAGCFSSARGVDLAYRMLSSCCMPNLRAATDRVALRDREASELYALCDGIARREVHFLE